MGCSTALAAGCRVAHTCVLVLPGRQTPNWVALPGLTVSSDNVVESFQEVWRKQPPREVLVSVKLVKNHSPL